MLMCISWSSGEKAENLLLRSLPGLEITGCSFTIAQLIYTSSHPKALLITWNFWHCGVVLWYARNHRLILSHCSLFNHRLWWNSLDSCHLRGKHDLTDREILWAQNSSAICFHRCQAGLLPLCTPLFLASIYFSCLYTVLGQSRDRFA